MTNININSDLEKDYLHRLSKEESFNNIPLSIVKALVTLSVYIDFPESKKQCDTLIQTLEKTIKHYKDQSESRIWITEE